MEHGTNPFFWWFSFLSNTSMLYTNNLCCTLQIIQTVWLLLMADFTSQDVIANYQTVQHKSPSVISMLFKQWQQAINYDLLIPGLDTVADMFFLWLKAPADSIMFSTTGTRSLK